MRAISQRIQGEIIQQENETHLRFIKAKPDENEANILYLRYAFVTLGREQHVFPAFLVDDWGSEVRGLKVYRWFREHANEHPRSEIFGFEKDGSEAQRFIREFEHYVKLPCYAVSNREQPVEEGILINKVIIQDPNITESVEVKTPSKEIVPMPLRRARVKWLVQPR